MSINWLKNRYREGKYFLASCKYALLKKRYDTFSFIKYWILCSFSQLFFNKERTIKIFQNIISKLKGKELIIPLLINNLPPYYIAIRDYFDFDTFKAIIIRKDYYCCYLKPGMTVIDVGAHIGIFTLLASRIVGEQGKVIAIEPEIHNFEYLKKNLELNKIKNTISLNIALGSFDGQRDFFIMKEISLGHSFFIRDKENYKKIKIKVKTLTNLVNKLKISCIDFLKINCEGAEYEIIANLPTETLQKINIINVEYHNYKNFKGIIDFLKERNFKIYHQQGSANQGLILAKKFNQFF